MLQSNKMKLAVAALGFGAVALLSACTDAAKDQATFNAACGHIDANVADALCKAEADKPAPETALVRCIDVLPEYRGLYPMCIAPSGTPGAISPVDPEPERNVEIDVISSGSRASLSRIDGHVVASACAGSTCSRYDSNNRIGR